MLIFLSKILKYAFIFKHVKKINNLKKKKKKKN